jgi:molybdate transport system substrate-binding protein
LRRRTGAIALFAAASVGSLPGFVTAPDPGGRLLVFAAASLTESLQDLGKRFESETSTRVEFSFGGSNDLARQIQAGAPADVFFSADAAKMDAVEKAGLVRAADRVDLLSNVLVVVVPGASTTSVRRPEDLAALPRIAVADPAAVPAGVYARKWLESLGLWSKLEPKIIPTLDVRAALAAVETEAAPAAIVYRTDAAVAKNARVAFEAEKGPEIVYVAAPLAGSRNRASAEAFVRFLRGPAGVAEFERRGFLVLPAK